MELKQLFQQNKNIVPLEQFLCEGGTIVPT